MGVTQIDFYTGATDRLLITCRLCTKAVQQGLRTLIHVPDEALADRLDKVLWTFSSNSFVPHCRIGDRLAGVTSVILNNRPELLETAGFNVLLNLAETIPSGFEHFQRIVEVVDEMEDNKRYARKRYRRYQDLGHDVCHHRLEG